MGIMAYNYPIFYEKDSNFFVYVIGHNLLWSN